MGFGFHYFRRRVINIIKIINNNVVSAYDSGGQEVVVMGRGIGFKGASGNKIEQNAIEKIFRMDNQEQTDQLKDLFSTHDLEQIEISNTIIDYAVTKLGTKLNPNIYLTLVDHIQFAIYRHNNNIAFHNAILNEIKIFYPEEFEIGVYAVRLIKKKTGIDFAEDEAAAIAIHIYNAEYETSIGDAIKATELADKIIRKTFLFVGKIFDLKLYSNQKLAAFLRTLCLAVIKKTPLSSDDKGFYKVVRGLYLKETEFAEKIAYNIQQEYSYSIPQVETATLAVLITLL